MKNKSRLYYGAGTSDSPKLSAVFFYLINLFFKLLDGRSRGATQTIPSSQKCSVWDPEKPLDTSFRWYDDSKKPVIASPQGKAISSLTNRLLRRHTPRKDCKTTCHPFIAHIIKLIADNFRSLIPYPLALTTVFMAFSLAHAGPAVINTLTASTTCQYQIMLTWTAPDNGAGGACNSYLVKYSTTADIIDEASFTTASTYGHNWAPRTPGLVEKRFLTGLIPGVTHYFSIKGEFSSQYAVPSTTGTNGGITGPFSLYISTLTGFGSGTSLAWGDYDNDGDLDLVACGMINGVTTKNIIYRNDNGSLNNNGAGIPDTSGTSPAWGDYDNDGDLDLALTGQSSAIYRNDSGSFSNINAGLTGLENGPCAWGDYDNDGDLDLAYGGRDSLYTSRSYIYRNDSGTFSDINAVLSGSYYNGALAWGDYDNDGDLDLAIAGIDGSSRVHTYLYRSDSGIFRNIYALAYYSGSVAFGDYDNDGDLDLAVSGYDIASVYRTHFYKSYYSLSNPNTAPSAPSSGFGSDFNSTTGILQLRWDYGSDTETIESKGLYYTVRIGTTTPMTDSNANKVSFKPATPFLGNYPHGYVVAASTQAGVIYKPRLTDTTYYWQVRTIDTSLKESAWSTEQSTYVPAGLFAIQDLAVTQDYQLKLSWVSPGNVSNYLVKYSSYANITSDEEFINAATYYQSWTPAAAGYGESKILTGLIPYVTYYFSIKWSADGSVYSPLSSTGSNMAIAAPYSIHSSTLTAVYDGSLAWGDYDNDGDLDLAAAGASSSRIYRNDSGVFNNISAALTTAYSGDLAWGDYDNDGDLDLALTGWTGSASISNIYRNDAGIFNNISAGIAPVYESSFSWGDYDNDGDLDLTISGYTSTYQAHIYRNDNGAFNNINAGLTGLMYTTSAWGDYDNDGDLDLAISGSDSGAGERAYIYRNDSGAFNNINAGLTGVAKSSLAWGDYDNDGDLDLAVSGTTDVYSSYGLSRVYRNDSGSFNNVGAGIANLYLSSLAWGDYDNDGDLDLAISGTTDGAATGAQIKIYTSFTNLSAPE